MKSLLIRLHDALSHTRHRAEMLAWHRILSRRKARLFPQGPRRILVVRLASLGDMIKLKAIVDALKRRHPQCRVEWLTSPAGVELSAFMPFWDKVWGLADLPALASESFDWVINLQRPDPPRGFLLPDQPYVEVLKALARVPALFRTGRRWVDGGEKQETVIFYCRNEFEELQLTALLPLDWRMGLNTGLTLLPEHRAAAQAMLAQAAPASAFATASAPSRANLPKVGLFIGAASASDHDGGKRSYSLEYLKPLTLALAERHEVWLFGQSQAKSETERGELTRFLAQYPQVRSVIDATDLTRLLGFIEGLDAVVTCDSGPLHMAMALKKPLVALYANAGDFRLGGPREQERVHRINAFEPCFSMNYRWKFFCDACEEKHWRAYGCAQKQEMKPLDRIPITEISRHLEALLASSRHARTAAWKAEGSSRKAMCPQSGNSKCLFRPGNC